MEPVELGRRKRIPKYLPREVSTELGEIPQDVESWGDEELCPLLVLGDRSSHKALEILMKRHSPMLLSIVISILYDQTEAQDVVQEAWFQFWDHSFRNYNPKKGKLV